MLCRGVTGRLRFALRACLGRSVHFSVAGAQPIRIILESLLGIAEDFIGCLNGLELGIELQFSSRIPVRMIFER